MVVSLYIFIPKYYKPQHTLNIKETKEGEKEQTTNFFFV